MQQRQNDAKKDKIGEKKMSDNDDVIKNPFRSIPKTQTKYEPEYVRHGITPKNAPETIATVAIPASRKRDLNSTIQQLVPEVFNSINGQDFDIDGNEILFETGHIIDNNEFVSFGYAPNQIPQTIEIQTPFVVEAATPEKQDNTTPQVGEYILMVRGKLITTGNLDKVEKIVRGIIYGENKEFIGQGILVDDIVVLKRVDIKVGIFVEK